MRQDVALFFLVQGFRFGGFFTFTEHLARALALEGMAPQILRIAQRTESRLRPFRGAIPYQNMCLADALALAHMMPSLICCAYWRPPMLQALQALLRAGAGLVVHDPTEITPTCLATLRTAPRRPIVIRQGNQTLFAQQGVAAIYIPHPYVRCPTLAQYPPLVWQERPSHAVTLSRLDFDKHLEDVLAANALLPVARQVGLYGECNRLYIHHRLAPAYPHWETWYRGAFPAQPWAGVHVAAQARYVVDMSRIKGDGGGTQYTFFEAWDAGACLIVHAEWCRPGGTVRPGYETLAITHPLDLAQRLAGPLDEPPLASTHAAALLQAHSSAQIIPHYRAYWEGDGWR